MRNLMLERLSTTIVYILLYKALGAKMPVVRAVASNVCSALLEWLFIDVFVRYVYLKGRVAQQKCKAG